MPASDLPELDRYLSDLARELGQVAIWRIIVGEGKAIPAAHGSKP